MVDPSARVLVCTLNSPVDLEIARWDHWYRIPVKHAPAEYLVEVLAFYLTAAFGDEKWAISEYAEVRGHELVRRVDLFPTELNHPRANDLYYKLQLGPLQRLARPIPSLKWRRLTFLQTTGDRLLHALDVNELVESTAKTMRYVTLMEDDVNPTDQPSDSV